MAIVGDAELGEAEFRAVATILHQEARIALSEAKRTLVRSRLGRRLRVRGVAEFADYVRLVRSDPEERAEMVTALTTNHTHFFREVHHFDHFRREVLPTLHERLGRRPLRLWSAGCSSGEEVYSLAMCLVGEDRLAPRRLELSDVRLLATDLSPPMVTATRAGRYAAEAAAAVPAAYRKLWLAEADGGVEVAPELRALVQAKVLNLFERWPMQRRFDVIFCRNVMIYFDDAAKRELEARLVAQLQPGGTLYIGHSERLSGSAEAQVTSCGHTIYRKLGMLP